MARTEPFPIGTLAKRSGVKVPTIRFYEEIGILPCPSRSESNRRLYGEDAVRRLRFVRHARELGFDIDAIRELLAMSAEPQQPCERADAIARRHLAEVERRIERLNALRGELERMIGECSGGRVCECRVIEVIADHGECTHHRSEAAER